uniref:Saposin B-type domain-containing protein n=1 Tax=Cyprinus carpio TaxID=7962 RepID=A0A8C1SGI6_CYPCA
MLRSIILITLLISSVCALHLEMHKAKSTGIELKEDSVEMPSEQLPGLCWACKWAMGKLKSEITKGSTKVGNSTVSYTFTSSYEANGLMLTQLVTFLQDDIKNMLGTVCDGIGFLKYLCRMLVNKYMGTLIEELSTTDDARTICVHVGIC